MSGVRDDFLAPGRSIVGERGVEQTEEKAVEYQSAQWGGGSSGRRERADVQAAAENYGVQQDSFESYKWEGRPWFSAFVMDAALESFPYFLGGH